MQNALYTEMIGKHLSNDRAFLKFQDGSVMSYRAFGDLCGRVSNAFHTSNLGPGDCVAVQAEKSPMVLAIYTACVQSGLVFLPLNTAYTPSEVEFFLKDSGARLFLCKPQWYDTYRGALGTSKLQIDSLSSNGSGTFADKVKRQSRDAPVVARHENNLAVILYTSGTTGRSKGAMLTHKNLLSNAKTLVEVWQISENDILLHALPIFHIHGLFVAVNTLMIAGGCIEFLPRFDLDQVFPTLSRSTMFMGVPTFYNRMLDDRRLQPNSTRNIRLFVSGSAPLLNETSDQFRKCTGHTILERYGMTETNMITSNPYEGERRRGTVGLPLPGVKVRVVNDDNGVPCSVDEVGQIEVQGPNVCAGYWKLDEMNKQEFSPDGFFKTGDIGSLDEDGYLTLTGRAKDLIISGGYNIYPKEVEQVLDRVFGVLESAVVGIPDDDFGERVLAVVVETKTGAFDKEVAQMEVTRQLAKYKHPKMYSVVSELPRNALGKVQKNVLRDRFSSL